MMRYVKIEDNTVVNSAIFNSEPSEVFGTDWVKSDAGLGFTINEDGTFNQPQEVEDGGYNTDI